MAHQMAVEGLLRELAPEVLSALLRRYRNFDAAEDAVQEALLGAALSWPRDGLPDNPRGWLIQVAFRRLTDQTRSDQARRRREEVLAGELEREEALGSMMGVELGAGDGDDTLLLLFMCCHPSLTPSSAIALTLRAIGGLTTAEIAKAFLVAEATMAQRISRAKQAIVASGVPFQRPTADEWPPRLKAVLHVLYLMFNEGYASSMGPELQRSELTAEAIRLTRSIHQRLPDDGEVAGLLALMLLTDARRPARTAPSGDLIPLDEQDRTLWDQASIAEGSALISQAFARGAPGAYQLQAAVAALHDEAGRAEETDWPQILALYTVLEALSENPMVMLNRAIALAMVAGPRAGLDRLTALDGEPRLAQSHRLTAARAHLLEMAGEREAAKAEYLRAAAATESLPEQRYLTRRAERLDLPAS
jgi:RNA polymerase sigma factor (sigma-70 family)